MINPPIVEKLIEERKATGNLRKLKDYSSLIDFSSNDYLGLAHNVELAEQCFDYLADRKGLLGGTGSRLLSGNNKVYTKLEEKLASVFNAQDTLLFNSGYAANQGLISALVKPDDTIIYDQLSHACIKEGIWLSRSKAFPFRHNSMEDLEKKLSDAKGVVYVVTESVFSMDGDVAPLQEIVTICKRYNAFLIVDEAHGTGIYGGGAGKTVELGLEDDVYARVYTFGKAIGYHGACVAGSTELKNFLVNFSRPFIYTTSLPPHSVVTIGLIFDYLEKNHKTLRNDLEAKISFFKKQLKENLNHTSSTAIQPILIPGNELCSDVASELRSRGFDVRAILSPTVRKGEERLRINIHVHNSMEEIEELAGHINSLI